MYGVNTVFKEGIENEHPINIYGYSKFLFDIQIVFFKKNIYHFPVNFAFCIFKYFPFGGLERDFTRIIQACQQNGHDIDVYTMKWEGEKPENLRITLIPSKGQQY